MRRFTRSRPTACGRSSSGTRRISIASFSTARRSAIIRTIPSASRFSARRRSTGPPRPASRTTSSTRTTGRPASFPVLLERAASTQPAVRTPTVFTIHNLAYQGVFDASWLPRLGLGWDLMRVDAMEYWGRISYLKAGIVFSRLVTTVSPTYAAGDPDAGARLRLRRHPPAQVPGSGRDSQRNRLRSVGSGE